MGQYDGARQGAKGYLAHQALANVIDRHRLFFNIRGGPLYVSVCMSVYLPCVSVYVATVRPNQKVRESYRRTTPDSAFGA